MKQRLPIDLGSLKFVGNHLAIEETFERFLRVMVVDHELLGIWSVQLA